MSAKERREHLERAIQEGGTIMTARGTITRQVPSSSTLARTPEERLAARDDLERRMLALQQEARRLEGDDEEDERDFSRLERGRIDRRPPETREMSRESQALGNQPDQIAGAQTGGQQNQSQTERTIESATGDELPKGFPARETFVAAGYTTLTAVNSLSREEMEGLNIRPAVVDKVMALRAK